MRHLTPPQVFTLISDRSVFTSRACLGELGIRVIPGQLGIPVTDDHYRSKLDDLARGCCIGPNALGHEACDEKSESGAQGQDQGLGKWGNQFGHRGLHVVMGWTVGKPTTVCTHDVMVCVGLRYSGDLAE